MQDIRDLLEGLKRTPKILSEFVKTIPEGKMDLRRGEGFWTVAEHVSHLAQVQPISQLLGGQLPYPHSEKKFHNSTS